MKIISVTGTKGKTTVTRILSHVLHAAGNNTLHVDTDGYYINQVQQGTLDESKALFNLVPTVSPGKYLLSMKEFFPDYVAVLECSIGSSGSAGLGYGYHHVGIFTNVFEDHLGASKRLKTRADIAKHKSFIFKNLRAEGYAIFNADDKLVTKQLEKLPADLPTKRIPCGLTFTHFDIESHLNAGGVCFTVEAGWAVLKEKQNTRKLIELSSLPWTFNGIFLPSVYNVLFVLAGIYGYLDGKIPTTYLKPLRDYRFPLEGGRITLFQAPNGTRIIMDYAHEKNSLRAIGQLAKKIARENKGRALGVVRLAPDRTDKMIHETGRSIAKSFDQHIVYDKIDGVAKKEYRAQRGEIRYRAIGEVSKIFFEGLQSAGVQPEYELTEEGAIRKAAALAKANDVVVVICGDDHTKTVRWIQKYFKAQLA